LSSAEVSRCHSRLACLSRSSERLASRRPKFCPFSQSAPKSHRHVKPPTQAVRAGEGIRRLRLPPARREGQDGAVHPARGARHPGRRGRALGGRPAGVRERRERGGREPPAGRGADTGHRRGAGARRGRRRHGGAAEQAQPAVPEGVRRGGDPPARRRQPRGARGRAEQRRVPAGVQPGAARERGLGLGQVGETERQLRHQGTEQCYPARASTKILKMLKKKDERGGPRPRLCQLGKGANGYGFNLHSEKSKPGQFIRAVDDDSPAQRAGLKPQDKIIQVNGVSVIGMQHSEVVAAIKAGGDQTRLLVVDAETDEFFRRCNVLPLEEHVSGPLPEPGSERASEDEEASAVMKPHASRSSSASSDALLPAETTGSPPPGAERAPEAAGSLGLSMSLAQARERAHQKRSAKKAPPMDWSKRNELFSNL
uniref:Na(+)/H(+) exchange regulatory cofactor NHE-RF1 n=1 Tax=Scophthalmus maximus TaxID=52904 RepID=A0A8D2ZIT8_SCOMX